jgi:hypothetical protein
MWIKSKNFKITLTDTKVDLRNAPSVRSGMDRLDILQSRFCGSPHGKKTI